MMMRKALAVCLLGDVVLTERDIDLRREYPDAAVTMTWPIEPYPIPCRCLYSRNVDNLFMAGRDRRRYYGLMAEMHRNKSAQTASRSRESIHMMPCRVLSKANCRSSVRMGAGMMRS